MGTPMARNLAHAGHLEGVWNRSPAKSAALAAELHCAQASSPADLAARCEALVINVAADADVLEVIGRLEDAVRPGTLVIDCSTTSATTARAAAGRLAARGVEFLDCPVSGGVEGARDATLAIMCGGHPLAFERARPVLGTLGRSIAWFG